MLIKRPKPKKFDYYPRYYQPENDQDEKRKSRLGFKAKRKYRRKGRSSLFWLVLFFIILYIYLKFQGYI